MHSLDMNPRELLKLLMATAHDNPNSLSQKTKVPQPTIFRFISGEAREPRRSTLAPIAKHYGVPIEALFDAKEAAQAAAKIMSGANGYVLSVEGSATFAEPPISYREHWPFTSIAPPRYEALPDRLKGVIEGRALAIIEEWERTQATHPPTRDN